MTDEISTVKFVMEGVDKVSGVLSSVGSAFSSVLAVGVGAATAALGGLTAILGVSVSEAMEAEKIQAQLAQVIKATGGAAGITADEANDLAQQLKNLAGGSDDAVLAAETAILQFTNIGEDVFPQATEAALNVAAALGISTDAAGTLVGKILDTGEGFNALKKAGLTLTDAQEKQIKALYASGKAAEAQQLILDELAKTTGGAAAAQANTLSGKLEIMKNTLLDAAEGIGTALLPTLSKLFDTYVTPGIAIVEKFAGAISGMVADFLDTGDIGVVIDDLREGLAGLLPQPVIDAIANFLKYLRDDLPGVLANAQTAIQPIIDAATNLASAFVASLPMIQTAVGNMVAFVQEQFAALSPVLIENVSSTLNSLSEFWTAHGAQIMAAVQLAFEFISVTVGTAMTAISGLVAAGLELINGDTESATDILKTTFTTVMDSILSLVGTDLESFVESWQGTFELLGIIVQTGINNVVLFISQGILDAITAAQAIVTGFADVGAAMMQGLQDGVESAVQGVIDAATGAVSDAIQAAKNLLGIHSPSRVFAEIGGHMMAGMAQGISANSVMPEMAVQRASQTAVSAAGSGMSGGMAGMVLNVTINIPPMAGLNERTMAQEMVRQLDEYIHSVQASGAQYRRR